MHDSILSFVWLQIVVFGVVLTMLIAHSTIGLLSVSKQNIQLVREKKIDFKPEVVIRFNHSPSYFVVTAIATSLLAWFFFVFAGEYAEIVQIGGVFWAIVVLILSALGHGIFCLFLILIAFFEMFRVESKLRRIYADDYYVKSELATMMTQIFLSKS